MPARLQHDPDRYIRRVKGGRFQARPWADGERFDLGLFATQSAARKAISDFWWGKLKPRPRYVRRFRTLEGLRFVAEPIANGRRIRLLASDGGRYFRTEAEAAAAVERFLVGKLGEEKAAVTLKRQ